LFYYYYHIMTNRKIVLIARPSGPLSGKLFEFRDEVIPALSADKVLVKTRYLSVDPYMRNRMNAVKTYIEPFELNEVLSGDGIAEVFESGNTSFKKGDLVTGILPWQEYSLLKPGSLQKIPEGTIPPTAYLGVLGLTGLTAYFGMLDIGKPAVGESVVVSGAAGAVGSIAGQIAKLKGCRVTGIAGTDEKVSYLKEELGFDEAFNYKTSSNPRKSLKKINPGGVDIYFDNVGGEISDGVMYLLNDKARIILCGQIAQYNQSRITTGPRLNSFLLIHRALMKGFIVYDYAAHFEEARLELLSWIREGKIKYRETVVKGFEKVPEALMGLFRGDNTGKQIVAL